MSEALLSVLIADDEYWIRENLRTAVDWKAYDMRFLEPAGDGEEALSILKSRHVDILITDINMPYVSGVELIHEARRVSPHTVVLALSGYSDYAYVREALLEGALDYLLKPISKAKLLEALDKAIKKVLERQREEKTRAETARRLNAAASAIVDRDFSELLHAARHQDQAQRVEAELFEYEQRFSGYRLTLFQVNGASVKNGFEIKQLLSAVVGVKPQLIVHNLYHLTHFLLITPADLKTLLPALKQATAALREKTRRPIHAVVSDAYLSFGDLRKAYNDCRAVLLNLPMHSDHAALLVSEQEKKPLVQRLTPVLQKQMEQAVSTQRRAWFDQLVEQTGLWSKEAQRWPQIEYLHCVTSIAWVLRRSAEERGEPAQMLDMETFTDVLPGVFTDSAQLREVLMQMEDEVFASAAVTDEAASGIIHQVKQYVDAHYTQELSLSDLASRFSTDSSDLSRLFKQVVGNNLTVYLTELRVQEAKRLLAQRELSITDVAQTVGYDDYSYFSRVFKKRTGMSPRRYREEGRHA